MSAEQIRQAHEKVKNLRKKYIQNGIILVVTGVVLILVLRSIAWFASNETVNATGMNAGTTDEVFELEALDPSSPASNANITNTFSAATRSNIDTYMNSDEYYYFDPSGNPDHKRTTRDETGVYWRLVDEDSNNETNFQTNPMVYPGSYGTLSFYIVPYNTSSNISVELSFELNGIEATGVNRSDASFLEALDYLKGHILFFMTRTTSSGKHYYADRIDGNSTFIYNTADHQTDRVGDKYRIDLYWIWPKTFGQIVKETGDGRHDVLFNTTAPRTEIDTYMKANTSFFFRNVTDVDDMLLNYGSNNTSYVGLSDGYNNADQLIGEKIRYLIAGVIAQPD